MALRANNYKLDIHVIIGATAKVALIGKCLLALPFLMWPVITQWQFYCRL